MLAVYCCTPKRQKYQVMMLELASLASLLIFLPLVGACEPGLANSGRWWAMVGAWWQRRMRRRPTRDPATCQPGGEPPFGITWPRFNLPSSTHLDFDPFHRYSTQVWDLFLNICLSIQTKSRVSWLKSCSLREVICVVCQLGSVHPSSYSTSSIHPCPLAVPLGEVYLPSHLVIQS